MLFFITVFVTQDILIASIKSDFFSLFKGFEKLDQFANWE